MHRLSIYEDFKVLGFMAGGYVYAEVALPLAARVLEVGSGQDPHPGADVILDKYPDDNAHRPGLSDMARVTRLQRVDDDGAIVETLHVPFRFVQGDVQCLPFADKSFDFVIARDVLEHIDDVEAGFREVSRVGRAGFVDVPRMTSEWLFPQGWIHKNVFTFDGARFYAHPIAFDTPWKRLMHDYVVDNKAAADAWAQSRHFFHVAHMWYGSIECVKANPAKLGGTNPIADLRGVL